VVREQLLAPELADPVIGYQEQAPGRREAIDMTALWALREFRTDVEALDRHAALSLRSRGSGRRGAVR
jgi:hypothetical protein